MKRFNLFSVVCALLTAMLLGCMQGGVSISPLNTLSAKFQNAENVFDEAEAAAVYAYDDEKQKRYDKARYLYLEVIEHDAKRKYAQRAHYQLAEIYKRHYKWDKVNEHYQAIVDIATTGYYANEAKKASAHIHKNREIIRLKNAEYHKYKAWHEQDATKVNFNRAAEALYEVARAHEELGDNAEAIQNYERMVKEFPKHTKAPQAQFQIGNIYFYALYDYLSGWTAFVKVADKFPNTNEAIEAKRLLIHTGAILIELKRLTEEIALYTQKGVTTYIPPRSLGNKDFQMMWMAERFVQNYQQVANNWEKLRNYPRAIQAYKRAIQAYKKLANPGMPFAKFAAADALYRAGTLYQQNGEYERAIRAYDSLFESAPESTWRNEAVYQQSVCYRAIREFGSAYEGFKAYMSITKGDTPYLREAEQIVRQFELDQDQDGYLFYQEQEEGTSDQDANSYPGSSGS